MAEKRMFARKIVESAKFLKMPPSTQNLYFHLALNADDDGVVEAYSVINLVKANEDDLRILFSKGFVTILNEDLVTYIQDWRIHNKLRADRKSNSIYQELLLSVLPETNLLEKKQRSDLKKTGRSTDGPWTAQYSVVESSIDENSIGECKAFLGNEYITLGAYENLISNYRREIVDDVINRIVSHPYLGCLNVPTITKWCEEAQRYSSTKKRGQNNFNDFMHQEYNVKQLEEEFLANSVEKRNEENECK